METTEQILEMVYDSIEGGGSGVAIGRNVFQAEDPTKMVRAIAAIVHERCSVKEALRVLE
jgi:fructose-bisphosphate aldolase/2-amino-3,7-dideoxy-D-threo-hept-6-ulosonate synthase